MASPHVGFWRVPHPSPACAPRALCWPFASQRNLSVAWQEDRCLSHPLTLAYTHLHVFTYLLTHACAPYSPGNSYWAVYLLGPTFCIWDGMGRDGFGLVRGTTWPPSGGTWPGCGSVALPCDRRSGRPGPHMG